MKIENGYNKYLQNIQQTNQNAAAKKAEQETAQPTNDTKKVEVNISEEAKQLSKLSQNEVRQARIDSIKASIEDGSYEINAKDITEGIVREMNRQKGFED